MVLIQVQLTASVTDGGAKARITPSELVLTVTSRTGM